MPIGRLQKKTRAGRCLNDSVRGYAGSTAAIIAVLGVGSLFTVAGNYAVGLRPITDSLGDEPDSAFISAVRVAALPGAPDLTTNADCDTFNGRFYFNGPADTFDARFSGVFASSENAAASPSLLRGNTIQRRFEGPATPAAPRLASLGSSAAPGSLGPGGPGVGERRNTEPHITDPAVNLRLPLDPDSRTAIYDITARTVYLPNGHRLEAHSGLGPHLDDPGSIRTKMMGVTPPNVYNLTLREHLFHGVRAIRLLPVEEGRMFGRDGILAHSYMLGPNGQSNGCVSFRDYPAFLNAFLKGEVNKLVVVDHLATTTAKAGSSRGS